MKRISSRRRPQGKAESNNGSVLESILKETPKLILARRISKALSQVSKGSPLTVAQAKRNWQGYFRTVVSQVAGLNWTRCSGWI